MKRFVDWLRRVHIAVWIFVALSGGLLVVSRPSEIMHLQRAIDEMSHERGFSQTKDAFVKIRDSKWRELASGSCTLIGGTSLAIWKWARQRRNAQGKREN